MGSFLISISLIILIIILSKESVEVEHKLLIGAIGYLTIAILCIIFRVDIVVYIIGALSAGFWLKYKSSLTLYSTKIFLVVACGLTFLMINSWAFAGAGILWIHFDYGFFSGLYKGFVSMNSMFDCTVELANELFTKLGSDGVPEELRIATSTMSKDFDKIDTLKALIDLLGYL